MNIEKNDKQTINVSISITDLYEFLKSKNIKVPEDAEIYVTNEVKDDYGRTYTDIIVLKYPKNSKQTNSKLFVSWILEQNEIGIPMDKSNQENLNPDSTKPKLPKGESSEFKFNDPEYECNQ